MILSKTYITAMEKIVNDERKESGMSLNIEDDNMCFACGQKNPISLGLKFQFYEENKVKANFKPRENLQGFKNIVHGGIITTILDEAMSKVVNMKEFEAVTAEMTVRFKKPVPINNVYIVNGIFNKKNKNLLFTEAILKNREESIYAKAEAKFMDVSKKKTN